MRKILIAFFLLLLPLLAACVTVPVTGEVDLSHMVSHEVLGLEMKLPAGMKRFNEDGYIAFRPDPPLRTSPGVLVLRQEGKKTDELLRKAYIKVEQQMSGEPIYVFNDIGGKKVKGVYAELVTHFVWIYIFAEGNSVWTLQIAAPLDWTDENALAFHDKICQTVKITG